MAKLVTHIQGHNGPACGITTRTLRASEMVTLAEFADAPHKCTRCEKRYPALVRMAARQ